MKDSWVGHGLCYDWYKELEKDNLILSFKGDFNHELVKAILVITQQGKDDSSGSSRIFGVIVECLQNVCKHGAPLIEGSDLHPGIVLLGKDGDAYVVGVANVVYNTEIDALKARIDKVNSMNEDGLRKMQHDILLNSSLSEEGNAGIGIIYMARKSEGNIIYNFREMGDGKSFFSVQLRIKG